MYKRQVLERVREQERSPFNIEKSGNDVVFFNKPDIYSKEVKAELEATLGKLGATRFGSVQTKYVDAARPHFRKKIAKQEKEAAAIAANLAAGLTADGRAK